ncbi:MAG: FprA family A-type flavoprotein, partial [Bacteriovoracaceae bacterium]|nr:FprA family A-type flavoprotein [Bacteriovoracaceae bacterium]
WGIPSDHLASKAKQYFAEIMLPFRKMCAKYEAMIRQLNPQYLLPSHGPLYKDDGVKFILDLYQKWSADQCENVAFLPYVSMYQTSLELVQALAAQLNQAGIKAIPFDLVRCPLRDLAGYLVDAQTIILACSMVLGGPHPAAMNFAYLAKLLRPKAQYLGIIGSFGWGGKLAEPLLALLEGLGATIFPAIVFKGKATAEDFQKVHELGQAIIQAHQNPTSAS